MATDDLVVLAAAGVAVVGVADRAGDHHAADHEAGAAHGREADARVAGRLAQRREVEVTLTAWRLRLLGNRDERFVACGGPAALQARCLHVLGAQDHEGLELSVGQDAVVVGICLAREGAHEQLSKEVVVRRVLAVGGRDGLDVRGDRVAEVRCTRADGEDAVRHFDVQVSALVLDPLDHVRVNRVDQNCDLALALELAQRPQDVALDRDARAGEVIGGVVRRQQVALAGRAGPARADVDEQEGVLIVNGADGAGERPQDGVARDFGASAQGGGVHVRGEDVLEGFAGLHAGDQAGLGVEVGSVVRADDDGVGAAVIGLLTRVGRSGQQRQQREKVQHVRILRKRSLLLG